MTHWTRVAADKGEYDEYVHAFLERWECPDCEWDCMCDADHERCNRLAAYHYPSV